MLKVIETDQAPAAIGTYSQAIVAGELVFISGQIGLDPQTMTLADSTAAQSHQIFKNLTHLCREAGGGIGQIVKLTVYLVDLADFSLINDIMQEYFQSPYPARAAIEINALPKNARIEIDAIMQLMQEKTE